MDRHREHQIAPGVWGWLESPASKAIAPDCVIVSGWAFVSGSRITEIAVRGFGDPQPLQCGLGRDDVAAVYPHEPSAWRSGFSGYLEFEGAPGRRVQLDIWATLDDGRSIRLFSRQVVPRPHEHPHSLWSLDSWRSFKAAVLFAFKDNFLQGRMSVAARSETKSLPMFLRESSPRLVFAEAPVPAVSVVVVVWNRADLTLNCLRALADQRDAALEVIVVDNGSTDETADLLRRIDGVNVVRNVSNVGFTVAANAGARMARGEFLLFLNNDAEVRAGAIAGLLATALQSSSIGAVGGKLIFPDGRLQEAGAIVWSDGSCEAYGRGGDPSAPEFNFERAVDFCSAALLLTRRKVFESLAGFDERYRPAYYEDADYCARLWAHGYSVVYQPRAVAIHAEFASATSREAGISLQRARRPIFVARHGSWLSPQRSRADGVLAARSHPHGQPSVIVVDDAAPDPRTGAGFPRAFALLRALADLGYLITIYATSEGEHPARPNLYFPTAEVVGGGPAGLRAFLTSRTDHRLVVVSRPHNMQYVKAAVGSNLSALRTPCVYDAEAIYAVREIGRRRLVGRPMSEVDAAASIGRELALTRRCAAVLSVSEPERQLFLTADIPNVFVVGHTIDPRPTPNRFEYRRSFLFVGAFTPDSPNEDAVRFLCREVLPALRMANGCRAPLVVAGARIPNHVKIAADGTVSWHSDVDDLDPLYDDARVFVAPMRYGAGIPLKVIEAAARGVPIVGTPLVARQLGWKPGRELLTAENPLEFANAMACLYTDSEAWVRLREAALKRIASDHNLETFRSSVQKALEVTQQPFAGMDAHDNQLRAR